MGPSHQSGFYTAETPPWRFRDWLNSTKAAPVSPTLAPPGGECCCQQVPERLQ